MASRIITVLGRFDISSKRFEYLLNRYSAVTRRQDCVHTFTITAVVLKRHPKLVRELCHQGVEFAGHGYSNTDYSVLPLEEQAEHLQKAIGTFKSYQVPFTGFQAPFLCTNDETNKVLSHFEISHDSSYTIYWDIIDKTKYPKHSINAYDRELDFYQPREAQEHLALPRSIDGSIEIPVSIPDDEAIVDRLGITNKRKISEIWQDILRRIYISGELFTIQLHPERISYCKSSLINVMQQAKGLNPPVWIATLREITEWWKERDKFTFEIKSQDNSRYRVKADCSDRATVLLKNSKVNVPVYKWFNGYQSITTRYFILESPTPPVIGVNQDSSPAAISFLQTEGYTVEQSQKPDNYGIYLKNLAQFDEAAEQPLSHKIEQSDALLLRYWRWPDQARSAFSVTGDIDSITLIDFVLNIFENWRQNRRWRYRMLKRALGTVHCQQTALEEWELPLEACP